MYLSNMTVDRTVQVMVDRGTKASVLRDNNRANYDRVRRNKELGGVAANAAAAAEVERALATLMKTTRAVSCSVVILWLERTSHRPPHSPQKRLTHLLFLLLYSGELSRTCARMCSSMLLRAVRGRTMWRNISLCGGRPCL